MTAMIGLAALFMSAGEADASDYFLRFPWRHGKTATIINGYDSPPSHVGHDSKAIDFKIEGGSTQAVVAAAAAGVVDTIVDLGYGCNPDLDYGNYVFVRSTAPAGETRYALYAHLSSVTLAGQTGVSRGQKIGVQGNSGWVAPCSAYHLHFRWTTARYCSPETWCAKPPEPMSGQTGFAAGPDPITSDNFAAKADFSGNGCPDVLGRNQNDTKLYYWPGRCDGTVGTGVPFGGGWDNYSLLFTPGDFSGDGCADIIGRRNIDDQMWYWRGNCAGGFLGSGGWGAGGWGAYDRLLGPGDLNGNGCGDILGINGSGQMYRWYGYCNATVGAGLLLGGGWNSYAWVMGPGDFNGDGCADLIARQVGTADMYWWRGNCAGGFYAGQQWGGGGWEAYHLIMGLWDFDARGCADIIARHNSTYQLYYWRGNCNAGASFGGIFGTSGWQNYNWLFTP